MTAHRYPVHMSDSTTSKPAISGTAITALVLGVLGLLVVIALIPGLKVLGLLLAIAAVIVGALGAVNARRRAGGGEILAWIGAGLGMVGAIWFLVWWLSWS